MPIDISHRSEMATLDQENVLSSIEQLPEQIEDAWSQTAHQANQDFAAGTEAVIVAGMGGSALGAEVIKSAAKPFLKVPFDVVKGYTLPGYINPHTLVVLSSYSGTTEETLTAAKQAEAAGCKIAVITSGGELASLMAAKKYPGYVINPKYNPSNQPRMAIGYTITGQIGLLHSFGLIDASNFSIPTITQTLRDQATQLRPEAVDHNPAKELAKSAIDKIIYLVSAEHLTGATHVVNNQLNENAKHLTVELQVPELNHHYMEGLPHPEIAKQAAVFWFIESTLYPSRIQLRMELTRDVVTQNGYQSQSIHLHSQDLYSQVFELIQLGAFTNFYLAMLHGINPAPIPWVDYFKDQLKSRAV